MRYRSFALLLAITLFSVGTKADSAALSVSRDGSSDTGTTPRRSIVTLAKRDDYTCSPTRECKNGACCGASGVCGYGPIFCGEGCTSNCDAKAECGQYAASPGQTCPLNVCCSQFGFCGTGSEFCGTGCQSNCGSPDRPSGGGDVRQRVIGYYEGWNYKKGCGTMKPSEIPADGLTHLNFAFAYIKPDSYDIIPMDDLPEKLFKDVTNLKTDHPQLKVWVSLGGWTFNDNNTQWQPVFSDIASSDTKSVRFAQKLLAFLSQYGFDGADLDWEYPGASDRGGHKSDVENYPRMLDIVRSVFSLAGRQKGLSITIPTSYWYLRWFDLPQIVKQLDFLNVMSYDLHGVWDSSNPIGPHVFAHTNLTEIDAALDLLWRNGVPSKKVNLGIGFYGRSFELKDSSCFTPGCQFKGPGLAGKCTKTSGILSYAEIKDIVSASGAEPVQDLDAGVNYLVYNNNNWVSYDDRATFQMKIDFANNRGLSGILIWAIDLDDDNLDALKAVTGKTNLRRGIAESEVFGSFNVGDCYITDCGGSCDAGYKLMTHTNEKDGEGCPNSNKNSKQRQYCCPEWAAPDPSTCHWYGTASACFGQCVPGEVLMIEDNYGGASHCKNGKKVWCCEGSNAAKAVAACEDRDPGKCGDTHPQRLTDKGTRFHVRDVCCPAQPEFKNCRWYGDNTSCNNNRCPAGQVEVTRDSIGGFPGARDKTLWKCVLGRNKVFCCDPPNGDSAFLPVPLENLFPDASSFAASVVPEYDLAFDDENAPTDLVTPDPNEEAFSWIIMVAEDENDLTSLRKRDGSDLEVFDCPDVHSKDFSTQKIRVVCMNDGPESNCEEIRNGGVLGTIVRLPGHCTQDEYVRAVSFEESLNRTIPHHIAKRAVKSYKVYDLHFDYNFKQLRRDGGEVYFRADVSNHPGYWDAVVAASHSRKMKRTKDNWREIDRRWYDEKTSDGWVEKFQGLLMKPRIGVDVALPFAKTIYDGTKDCGGITDARLSVNIRGTFSTQLDNGGSFIGKLRNFQFQEAYSYFRHTDPQAQLSVQIDGQARVKMQSQMISFASFDGDLGQFNIKGIFEVGPYVEISGQLGATGLIAGNITHNSQFGLVNAFDYMLPASLGQIPNDVPFFFSGNRPVIETTESSFSASYNGEVMVSVRVDAGYHISLSAFQTELVDTDIVTAFQLDTVVNIDASSLDCNGVSMSIDAGMDASLSLRNPLLFWSGGNKEWALGSDMRTVHPKSCIAWGSSTNSKRSEISNTTAIEVFSGLPALAKRADGDSESLVVDYNAEYIYCPMDLNTDAGECTYPAELEHIDESVDPVTKRDLEKRARGTKDIWICEGKAQLKITFPTYPDSSEFAENFTPHDAYGPTDTADCSDDYGFGLVTLPQKTVTDSTGTHIVDDATGFDTEHILEAQTLKYFLEYLDSTTFAATTFTFRSSVSQVVTKGFCHLMQQFWYTRFSQNGYPPFAINYLAEAYPGEIGPNNNVDHSTDELVLLTERINTLKQRLWSRGSSLSAKEKWNPRTKGEISVAYNLNQKVNILRNCVMLVKYLNTPAISQTFKTQIERVTAKLLDIDEGTNGAQNWLASNGIYDFWWRRRGMPTDPAGLELKDKAGQGWPANLRLADKWEVWIKAEINDKRKKLGDFITDRLQELEQNNQPPTTGNSGPPSGNTQTNAAIVARIAKLRAEVNRMGSVEFISPI
ncbi:hypothetical protein FN846DRAFT_348546 [Sphaerosporella brunnea]|uniref:chitinase n=1 Tax=Sphaerosporella brunnea TaxID=1250544 RepID=A0A5J5EJE7_9PEZI|nr:hypothetical protein FN846DRAFT_348546 [Sphaerosporella brunnea]